MSTQSDLAELYTTFFNRAPDAAGLTYWVNEISTGKLSLSQVAKNWTTQQAEGLASLPSTLTNTQFIEKIYTNILGRTADTGGSTYWLNQLNSGAVTRDTFALSVINGAKANTTAQGVLDTTLINNKATVGVAFANKGVNDTTLAAKVLTSVTANADTLASTLAVISLLPATAAAQTPAILSSANAVLTKFAALITAAPGEVADAATYLKALVAGATSTTNIGTLLDNANTLLTSAATNPAALDNPASQGAAAVVVATPSTGGGTTPVVNTINATAVADAFTLTSSPDVFVTKFGGVATAQVDTLTLTGVYETGDKITISGVATNPVVVTVNGSTTAAADIIAAVNAATGKTVTAASVDATHVTLTASTAGTAFTSTVVAANKAAVTAVAQVNTITLSGVYEAGDQITVTGVATNPVVVTVASPTSAAADIIAAVNAATGKTVTAAVVDSTHVTLTASTAGTSFTSNVTTANKAAVSAVAQVDTITTSGTYEAGDVITITGVATADVIVTVASPTSAAADIISAVNAAAGTTVTAASVDSTHVTLTASTAGTAFTATAAATNGGGNVDTSQAAAIAVTTPNVIGSAAGADTTQAALSAVTTANVAASAIGSDTTQAISKAITVASSTGGDSFSKVGTLDVLTGFTVGTDKVDLFSFAGLALAAPTSLTHVTDVTTGTDLATQLATAFGGIGANAAGVVTITTGGNAGTYLFANDGTAAFSATNDAVIKLSGVTLAAQAVGTTTLAVSDYFA